MTGAVVTSVHEAPVARAAHAEVIAEWTTVGAACAGGAAAVVHFAMAPLHAGESTAMAVGFATVAWVQLGLAAALLLRPARAIWNATALVHLAAIAAWAISRTTGFPVGGHAGEIEAAGLVDVITVGLEALVVLLAVAAIGGRLVATRVRVETFALPAVLVVLATTGLLAVAPPTHGSGTARTTHGADHAHGHDGGEPDAPLTSIVLANTDLTGATKTDVETAERLVVEMEASLARFPNVRAVEAAGYRSIGDGRSGFEHFVHNWYLHDGIDLDATRVESIVARVEPNGERTIVSGMFILGPDATMADVPDVAGPLTVWHDHQNLCWSPDGTRLAGTLVDGVCTPGGTFRPTPPMLHVWVAENPCGRFAGIENGGVSNHGTSCAAAHD